VADDRALLGLDNVHSLDAFAQACGLLRQGRSYAELARAARPRSLPAATLSDLLNAKSIPTRDTVVTFLTACGLPDADAQREWLGAWERVATDHQPRPAGAVRVRETHPRRLGVHAAIQVPGVAGELPPYVPRDLDDALRTAITDAADGGGFVVLIGSSSVGKTRTMFEAIRAVLPQWWLVHPDAADADSLSAIAAASIPRVVVWLDELQRYLDRPVELTAGLVRRLAGAGAVLVGTVWPDEYARRSRPRTPDQPDPHADAREVLDLATSIDVPTAFSTMEQRRAEDLADDQRIRIALRTADAGITQTLAAGPALVRWWETAPNPYGRAVITAVLDARRVGLNHAVTVAFLETAVPGYLTSAQQAAAPRTWLTEALEYATTPLHGAASALVPSPAGMGSVAGYLAADYLHQYALTSRRTVQLPDLAWQAIVELCPATDALELGEQAERRGRTQPAEALYRKAADVGIWSAADHLADLIAAQGRIDEAADLLRRQTDEDPASVNRHLIALFTGHGRADDAISLLQHEMGQDPTDFQAAFMLDRLLAEQHRMDELQQRAQSGDGFAIGMFADLLVDQGHTNEAIAVRGRHHRATRLSPFYEVAERLAALGRVDEAIAVLSPHVDEQDHTLADLLAQIGAVDELRRLARAGNGDAVQRLADILAEQGNIDDAVTVLLEEGGRVTFYRAATLLTEAGRIDDAIAVLRPHVGEDEPRATATVGDLLARQGRVEEAIALLRPFAARYDAIVRSQLAILLARQGGLDEAIELSRRSDYFSPSWPLLAETLAEHGRLDDALAVLAKAQIHDASATSWQVVLLTRHGRIDEATAALHKCSAENRTITLMKENGLVDDAVAMLRRLADQGDWSAAESLADLLLAEGRIEDLRNELAAGTEYAADRLRKAASDTEQPPKLPNSASPWLSA
jgi:tetratricopeptide (TPR) repeat protein